MEKELKKNTKKTLIKTIDVYSKAIDILSYNLMLLSNDTQQNWKKGAIKQAIWELAGEVEIKENENGNSRQNKRAK